MRVKFEATDAPGKAHKRSSMSHIYSHCVVIHFAAHPPSKLWPEGIFVGPYEPGEIGPDLFDAAAAWSPKESCRRTVTAAVGRACVIG